MLQNRDIDITDFLKLTNAGLYVADFIQVKNAIIKRYKLAYGDDIDLSTATADGIFVNDLALIINNILKTVSTMYANLDVNQASGVYLDMLCRLANVKRKMATSSIASIELTNTGLADITINDNEMFIDTAGNEWKNTSGQKIIAVGATTSIQVQCVDLGPIEAPAGYILSDEDASKPLTVVQAQAAIVGNTDETDANLRERRAQSNGAHGITVAESLLGALLEIDGIRDCKIYNNVTGANWTAQDTATKDEAAVNTHDVYIILRTDFAIDDAIIGKLIYKKLTPGIKTSNGGSPTNGIVKSYQYQQVVLGQTNFPELGTAQNVYWKVASPISTSITLTIKPNDWCDINSVAPGTNDTLEKVAKAVMTYLNNLTIGIDATAFNVQSEALFADPRYRGYPTFEFVSTSALPENHDTFYNYTAFTCTANGSNYEIELS